MTVENRTSVQTVSGIEVKQKGKTAHQKQGLNITPGNNYPTTLPNGYYVVEVTIPNGKSVNITKSFVIDKDEPDATVPIYNSDLEPKTDPVKPILEYSAGDNGKQ